MIESWVGEAAFHKAINDYVGRYKYGNAKAEDFWRTIAASTGKPVDRVMPTFVDQPGVPLITMSASCQGARSTVALSQSRYFMDGAASQSSTSSVWSMPVCLHTDSGPPMCELLERPNTTVTLGGCPAWTMPNAGGRGYYRTSLDTAALKALEGGISPLPGPERLTLLSDEWALVRAGRHDVGSYLDLASAFGSEEAERVLATLTGALRMIDQRLTTAATRSAFRAWVRQLFSPAAARLGGDAQASGSDDNARAVRAVLLRQLGEADDPDTIAAARKLVEQELAAPKSVDSTLLGVAVDVAARNGDASLYEKYLSRARSAVNNDPEDRYRFLYGLASFTDPTLIRRTMELALGPEVRSQDTKLVIAALLGNPAARDIAWDLVRERWDAVQKKTGEFVGNTVIVSALASFCDARHADEIKTFFAAHPVPDAQRTFSQTLERIDACTRFAAAQTPKLAEWLATQGR
jgi:aminopeptidase N